MAYDSTALEALRRGLAALRSGGDVHITVEQRDEIRDLVCAAVDELRAEQYTPEKALIAVKQAAAAAGIAPVDRHPHGATEHDGLSALLSDVSRWCIKRYFGVDPRR